MLKYEIQGGNLPVVVCYPEKGQALCTEKGAMSWMTPNMEMSTSANGGIGKAFGRVFSGESIFLNEYEAHGDGAMIAFASSLPGSIIPFELSNGESLVVQKRGFLAMEKGMELSVHFQRKLGAGFFGGEGFIMQKITGNGVCFVEIDGSCTKIELKPGESLMVDTGYLAAFTGSCSIDIERVKGVKNMLFGGEGLFNTKITGPGTVYLQSMPAYQLAGAIQPYIVVAK